MKEKKADHRHDHGHEKIKKHDHGPRAGHSHAEIPMGMAGHDHHRMMVRDFRKRFWVSTLITIPILIFSPMIQEFFGYDWLLPGNQSWLFGLSSIVYFWGGWPFLKGFVN
jgi:P-type Cu2+ transporter